MADFRNVAAEQKKEVGIKLNELKTLAQENPFNAKRTIRKLKTMAQLKLILLCSAYPVKLGTRHPLSIVKNEIIDIFGRLF